ncbi:MAG: hypothetical protein LLG40_05475 [Deltaproteobacteria bacterium]|nr:hypothetical protein [Deltaproteobacteria bacterium]
MRKNKGIIRNNRTAPLFMEIGIMKKENRIFRNKSSIVIIALLVFIAMAVISINACGFLASASWKEEVQLSDGRIIVVKRRIIREGGGGELASNPTLSKPKEYRINFAYPVDSETRIEWRSTKIDEGRYPEIPLILDLEAGQPIVYTILSISIACEVYNKYVYRNGVWIEEALPEHFEMRATNLFLKLSTDMPWFVNLETKRKENEDLGYRQSIKQVGPNRKVCGL